MVHRHARRDDGLTLVERPPEADVEQEKLWLNEASPARRIWRSSSCTRTPSSPRPATSNLGSYDLYVPSRQDERVEVAVQGVMREAILDARVDGRGLDRGS